jgi:hypothetical protein
MRKLLRKIILWALKSEPVEHDAAGMDQAARDAR